MYDCSLALVPSPVQVSEPFYVPSTVNQSQFLSVRNLQACPLNVGQCSSICVPWAVTGPAPFILAPQATLVPSEDPSTTIESLECLLWHDQVKFLPLEWLHSCLSNGLSPCPLNNNNPCCLSDSSFCPSTGSSSFLFSGQWGPGTVLWASNFFFHWQCQS